MPSDEVLKEYYKVKSKGLEEALREILVILDRPGKREDGFQPMPKLSEIRDIVNNTLGALV
jgi:hypothetical protein